MRFLPISAFVLIAFLVISGCQSKPASESATGSSAGPAVETGEQHAADDVVVGSYEDWCSEHGVAESACTRCDASLIPAFKAVGDWDDDHGLPKSQCLQCDPNLKIVRPPKPEAN